MLVACGALAHYRKGRLYLVYTCVDTFAASCRGRSYSLRCQERASAHSTAVPSGRTNIMLHLPYRKCRRRRHVRRSSGYPCRAVGGAFRHTQLSRAQHKCGRCCAHRTAENETHQYTHCVTARSHWACPNQASCEPPRLWYLPAHAAASLGHRCVVRRRRRLVAQ
jgi:hypothetical protein